MACGSSFLINDQVLKRKLSQNLRKMYRRVNAFLIVTDRILLSFQTIQEQQKVIRRLLKKTNSNNSSDSLKHCSLNGNSEEYNDLTGEPITF